MLTPSLSRYFQNCFWTKQPEYKRSAYSN